MLRRFVLFIAVFLVCSLTSIHANAAIDKKGAQHLKTMFEDMLKTQAGRSVERGAQLQFDGNVMVEPSGSYYAVTLPHITSVNSNGDQVELGMIALNVMPGESPELWKMTMAIPTPIVYRDAAGQTAATVTIGQQSFAGVWHETFRNYIKLQAQYKNIVFKPADGSLSLSVPDFSAVYDIKDNGQGLWSGPMRLTALGTSIEAGDGTSIKVGKAETSIQIFDYNFKEASAYREQLAAIAESYESGEESASPAHMQGLYKTVTDFIGGVWDGFNTVLTVENIDIRYPGQNDQKNLPQTIKLTGAGLSFGLSGFRRGSVTMNTGLRYNGLVINPPLPEFDETTPDHANIDLSIKNLPYKDITALGSTAVATAAQMPGMGAMVGIQALMSLPQLLTQAQTSLTVSNTNFGNKNYDVKMQHTITANLQAVKGATGKGTIEIAGLDKLAGLIGANIKSAGKDSDKTANLQELQSTLTMLQLAGRKDGGKDLRLYDLELNEQGQILLNGTDMTMLMGGATATENAPDSKPSKKSGKKAR